MRRSVQQANEDRLHVIAPASNTTPFEETSQEWRTFGKTVSDLTGARVDPKTFYSREKRFTLDQLISVHYFAISNGRSSSNNNPSYSNSENTGRSRRNIYSGRYCSYTSTKRVPQRVRNGTQTYLRRVVTQCSWNSLYCSPQVRCVCWIGYKLKWNWKISYSSESFYLQV